jgi:hypothetical protein
MRWWGFLSLIVLATMMGVMVHPVLAQEEPSKEGEVLRTIGIIGLENFADKISQVDLNAWGDSETLKRAGDRCKEKCDVCSSLFKKKFNEYYPRGTPGPSLSSSMLPPEQKDLKDLWDQTDENCENALKYYDLALDRTSDNNFRGKAALLERAAGVYRTVGGTRNEELAKEYEQAAKVVLAAGDIFEPLSPWIAVLGILVAVLWIGQRKSRGK